MNFNSRTGKFTLLKNESETLEKAEMILKNAGRIVGDDEISGAGIHVRRAWLKLTGKPSPNPHSPEVVLDHGGKEGGE